VTNIVGALLQDAPELPAPVVLQPTANSAADQPLTRQELKVLQLLAEGASNKRISDRFQISDSTVRTHLRSINDKLRVQSRLQAVSAGRAVGLLL
jgi:LuxR family transcriptional regulator, maltose regulon positive regulatory protein